MTTTAETPQGSAVARAPRVFLSHATADHEFVESVRETLEAGGYPCWVAYRDVMKGSEEIYAGQITRPWGPSLGSDRLCAVKRCWDFSGCNSHPATGSLQPVAIGAAVEETKPSEPSRQMCRLRRCSEPTGRNASER